MPRGTAHCALVTAGVLLLWGAAIGLTVPVVAAGAPLTPPGWSIAVTKTVSTQPDLCSNTSTLTVTAGSTVYYCVTVHNTGDYTLTRHTLEDSQLGSLAFDAPLAPGDSLSTVDRVLTLSAILGVTTTNTVTWTARPYSYETVTATAQATVYVTPLANLTRFYVDDSAVGVDDGSSWADAFADLQRALAVADAGDEVWVAAGAYFPTTGIGRGFVLKNGVAIFGGFAGTETALGQRNWQTNVTVISGDIDHDDITDAQDIVTGTTGIRGSNSAHVVTCLGNNNSAILDGFTITAGNNSGLYNIGGSPTLANLTVNGNHGDFYGGGMLNDSGNPSLTHITFMHNSSGAGGGLYNTGDPNLTDVVFRENDSGGGGGMSNGGGSPHLTNVTFQGNHAVFNGGGMLISEGSPQLTNVTFTGNRSEQFGGGLSNHGNTILTHVTFSDNMAPTGGGLYSFFAPTTLTYVAFSGNQANDGGGLWANEAVLNLTNVSFTGNRALDIGGGIDAIDSSLNLANVIFSGNQAVVDGGGIATFRCDYTLTNLTFSGNTASHTGAALYSNEPGAAGLSLLQNSIVWANTAPTGPSIFAERNALPTVCYTLVEGSLPSGATDGGHNLFVDPKFVRLPDPGDGDWGTPAGNDYGDLRLQMSSPAIDAGGSALLPGDAPDLDRDGDTGEPLPLDLTDQPRVVDGNGDGTSIVDMGAYEHQSGVQGGNTHEHNEEEEQQDLLLPLVIG